MSISTEINRLEEAKSNLRNAIQAQGVEVPTSASISEYADYINQIVPRFSVGTLIFTAIDSNPSTFYGGVWEVVDNVILTASGGANVLPNIYAWVRVS